MLIDSLSYVLQKSGCLSEFWGNLDEGSDATLGVANSARPFLVAARFAHKPQATLVVVSGEDAAVGFARNVAAYVGEERVLHFPERTDHPFASAAPDAKAAAKRLRAAYALLSGEEAIVVASARALVRMMAPASSDVAAPIVLTSGAELEDMGCSEMDDLAGLMHVLESKGYENTGELEGPGTFARHGGTIDVFPANSVFPVRLDFFGDELEEIRRIVPSTGQTISTLDDISIYPTREYDVSEKALAEVRHKLEKPALTNKRIRDLLEQLEGGLRFDGADALLPYLHEAPVTLGDYVQPDALVCLIEPRAIMDDAQRAFDDISQRAKAAGIPTQGLYAEPSQLDLGSCQHAVYVSIMQIGSAADDELPVKRVDVAGAEDKLFGRLRSWVESDYTCIFSASNLRAREDMKLALVERGLPIREWLDEAFHDADTAGAPSEDVDADDDEPVGDDAQRAASGKAEGRGSAPTTQTIAKLKRGVVNIVDVDIPLGMVIPKAKLAMVSLADTQGARGASRRQKRIDITQITFPYSPGDYVVHAVFGVALFKDIVRRDIDGAQRDYMELQYAEGDKLFLPVEQLDRVTRYVGAEGASPRLTRLNTSDWSRAIAKARKATKKLAFDLVDVYARRAATAGYRFKIETPWLQEMSDSFPYDETPDQAAAIADVLADMASSRPMDRLICGDVGFGKTEVALRAAFVAAQSGKQVMVLCPTTILAQQHYTSFFERLSPFGIKVEVLSRFRTTAQQNKTLEGFADGSVDVLIGTHRLLSRDVNPHDLGLVIIDEEQRFGVGHKEQLKNLRESIDVLTLSATPIPRTMQMATSGVRDMSLILTPPDDRLPVKVHVGEWDPDVVAEALRFELSRKGQVYYVSNRVRTIDEALERVREAAPEARIGVAHGQMTKEQLESVMEDFSAGELDVLVATTIIESGIDNPHTNTLIIEDSQRLGLAQMYQLKGRVGRSSVQAYAYFMFPEEVPLTEEAEARLMALNEHQDLGSGMRIAMRDLEIRGAGSMLGAEQSGNMSAVGFDLFAQMLNQAVAATREGSDAADSLPPALSDIIVNVKGDTYIPEEYIPDADARVLLYRRLASAATEEDVAELERSLKEQHPGMPDAAQNMFSKAYIKAFAAEHAIKSISVTGGNLVVEPISLTASQLSELRRHGGRYLKDKRKLTYPMRNFKTDDDAGQMQIIYAFLKDLYNGDGRQQKEHNI